MPSRWRSPAALPRVSKFPITPDWIGSTGEIRGSREAIPAQQLTNPSDNCGWPLWRSSIDQATGRSWPGAPVGHLGGTSPCRGSQHPATAPAHNGYSTSHRRRSQAQIPIARRFVQPRRSFPRFPPSRLVRRLPAGAASPVDSVAQGRRPTTLNVGGRLVLPTLSGRWNSATKHDRSRPFNALLREAVRIAQSRSQVYGPLHDAHGLTRDVHSANSAVAFNGPTKQ